MRIAIDLRPLNDGKVTGVQVYVMNLIKQLLVLDKQNHYVLFNNSFKHSPNVEQYNKKGNVEVKQYRCPSKVFNFSSKYLKVPKLDELVGGADIFFFPRYSFGSVSTRCKKVISVHDISFELDHSLFSFKRRVWHKLVSDKSSVKDADSIICVSASTKRDLTDIYHVDKSKLTITPLGVDSDIYTKEPRPHDESVRSKYDLNDDFLLVIATMEPRKNILGTIKAFEQLRSSGKGPGQLVLGGNLGWLYSDIQNAIDSSRFKEDIKIISPVEENEKPSLYRLAKVLAFPSFYEGFGLPPLEAASCGTPSVVGMNSSMPEVLGPAGTYVNPYRTDHIVEAILDLYSNPDLYRQKVESGIELARNFSWKQTALATLRVFQKTFSDG